ncbi:MAG: phasin [Hyphomicrobiales bacterium]|nr:phasin [Hyphomicrobiales bacterium]
MTEAASNAPKSKARPANSPVAGPRESEFPKFEIPSFEVPRLMEVPAAFRELAEKGASQAKETYEKMKAATEEATDLLEGTYANVAKGAADYGLKLIEASRLNANAAFDFYSELMSVKSYADMIELSTAHARRQFERVTAQTKDLTALAQRVAAETAEPIKESMTKALTRAS